jgi:hypothetical protein
MLFGRRGPVKISLNTSRTFLKGPLGRNIVGRDSNISQQMICANTVKTFFIRQSVTSVQ